MGKLITPFLPCVHLTTCGQMDMSSRELVKGRTSRIYGGANSPILSAIQSTQAHANTPIALAIAKNDKPTFKVLDSYRETLGGSMNFFRRLYRFLTLRVEIRMPRWRHEQNV
jgi:hypothetical protein